MFEDDEIDSEFIGVTQRFQNHKENQAIREEVAGLRADIKRKEDKERAAPKCPYCAGPIADGVVKCRHCASDIKWCEVNGRSYPLKAEVNVEQFVAREKEKQREKRRDAEASAKKEDERRDSIFRNLESKVRSLLETDGKISAIKSLRDECPYLGLADAKMQVDRLESGQSFLIKGDKLDGRFTDSSSGSGCLIVALTVPVGLLTFKALEHLLF